MARRRLPSSPWTSGIRTGPGRLRVRRQGVPHPTSEELRPRIYPGTPGSLPARRFSTGGTEELKACVVRQTSKEARRFRPCTSETGGTLEGPNCPNPGGETQGCPRYSR